MRVRMKGLWKPEEDLILKQHVETYGEGKWTTVPERSGLMRSAKSCRLRWKNYLSPRVKHGKMSEAEEDLIIRMHKLLGNRWSLIAGRLPGRTDNEVKNYWNTHLNKKCLEVKGECTSDDIIIFNAVDDSKKKKVYPNRIDSQPSFSDGPHSITAKESDHQGEEGSTKAKDPLMADDTMIFKYCDIRSPLLPINDNAAFSEAHISLLDSFLSFGTTAGSGGEERY